MVKLDWFMIKKSKQFLGITQILNEADDSVVVTEFVKNLLDQFWSKN